MSETEILTPPEPSVPALPPPAPAPVPAPPAARRPLWPVFFALGFLVLAGGEFYVWHLTQANAADATELAVLRAEVADLQNFALKTQAAPVNASAAAQADISQKLADLAAQVNVMQTQEAADHGTVASLQANSVNLTQLTTRMTLLSALENARIALDAGQPIGTIPNAPPALALFANSAPPTLAQLRETFPAAGHAAEAASVAGETKGTYWSRVLARLENFVTVTNGDHVVLGAPAAGVIGQAQTLLDAGDLAGAVAQLTTLSQSTQQAMEPWLAQAQSLLAAQSALVAMAGQA